MSRYHRGVHPHEAVDPAAGVGPLVPLHWPSAWPHLWPAVRDRVGWVAAVIALTVAGIVSTGDLAAQWWVLLLPLSLLTGPVSRPWRYRRALQRAAARGRLASLPGQLSAGTPLVLTPAGGYGMPLSTEQTGRMLRQRLAQRLGPGQRCDVLLVWVPRWWSTRVPTALVLAGPDVGYLDRIPRGLRPTPTAVTLTGAHARRV